MTQDLLSIRDRLVPAVIAAGRWVQARAAEHAWQPDSLSMNSKQDPTDFVTAVDLEVEQRLIGLLSAEYPDYGYLSEEGSIRDMQARRIWLLDPVDGTRNFIMNHAGYCISLALVEDRQPVLGIIYDIVADECYTAIRSLGAYCNGRPLQVSSEAQLGLCTVGVGFTPAARRDKQLIEGYLDLLHGTAALRQSGAAARDLAYVARGSLDAFWQPDLRPWDLAAGMLLVQEAGGVVVPLCSEGDWLEATRLGVLATNAQAAPGLRGKLGC